MHKIADKEFTLEDFSHERLQMPMLEILKHTIHGLNDAREAYLSSQDKLMWWQMIQLLPSSYNQRRTVMLSYEVLANIYKSRKNHKLDEWSVGFCDWIKTLPYSELITGDYDPWEFAEYVVEGARLPFDGTYEASCCCADMDEVKKVVLGYNKYGYDIVNVRPICEDDKKSTDKNTR